LKRRSAKDTGPYVVVILVVVVVDGDVRASVRVHGRSTAGHVGCQGVDGDDGRSDDEVPDNATSRFDEVLGDDGRGDEVGQLVVGNEAKLTDPRDGCVGDTAWAPRLELAKRKCERRKRRRVHDVTDDRVTNVRNTTDLAAQS